MPKQFNVYVDRVTCFGEFTIEADDAKAALAKAILDGDPDDTFYQSFDEGDDATFYRITDDDTDLELEHTTVYGHLTDRNEHQKSLDVIADLLKIIGPMTAERDLVDRANAQLRLLKEHDDATAPD